MKTPRYAHLLEDPKVKRWNANLARGSQVTADVYLRRLGNFCDSNHTTPDKLAAMSEEEHYNLLLDTVTRMEKTNAGSYTQSIIKAIKSWLAHNGIQVTREIKIRGAEDAPTLARARTSSTYSTTTKTMTTAHYYSHYSAPNTRRAWGSTRSGDK